MMPSVMGCILFLWNLQKCCKEAGNKSLKLQIRQGFWSANGVASQMNPISDHARLCNEWGRWAALGSRGQAEELSNTGIERLTDIRRIFSGSKISHLLTFPFHALLNSGLAIAASMHLQRLASGLWAEHREKSTTSVRKDLCRVCTTE